VEDERKLRELVRSYLERGGFAVLSAGTGAEALSLARSAGPDLVVLDLRLPDIPGETVASELRAAGTTPILMLTAKSAEEDRIRGLELGADDYVTKPFSPRELVLRVQAILRCRSQPAGDQGVTSYGSGTLVIDEPRRAAWSAGCRWISHRPSGASWSRWRLTSPGRGRWTGCTGPLMAGSGSARLGRLTWRRWSLPGWPGWRSRSLAGRLGAR
jgi:CheY-like chemotaxis protein